MTVPLRTIAALLAGFLLLTTACGTDDADTDMNTAVPTVDAAPAPLSDNLRADQNALKALDATYQQAMRDGDVSAILALHAENAVVLPPDGPILRGRTAIEAAFAAYYTEPTNTTLTQEEVHFSDDGTLGYIIGTSMEGETPGKYLTVVRRTPDGWKIIADAWNEAPQE